LELSVVRRRVVRDIGTLLGVVAVLVAVVLINDYMRRGSLSDQMDVIRKKAENDQKAMGVDLLHWNLLRETKGTRRS
jgi:Tfp pilus assembly ATPase PilU